MKKVDIVPIICILNFFSLSQDDKVVPSTDVEGVWAPNIEQSFQESLAKKRLFYVSITNIKIKLSMFLW